MSANNEEVCKKRISKIHKSIQRTINTAKFEGIVISSHIEEDIEWSTLEERETKNRNWVKLLIDDYKKTEREVLDELGLSNKPAHFKNYLDKDDRPDPNDQAANIKIDDLDTLG